MNRNKIKSEEFKRFYYYELKTKQKIQEFLVQKGRIDLLKEMLKDDYFTFNNNYIIKYIEILLKNKDVGVIVQEEKLMYFMKLKYLHFRVILHDIIFYDLYDEKIAKLLLWFLGNMGFYEIFR